MNKLLLLAVMFGGLAYPVASHAAWLADMISVPGETADLTPGVQGVQAEVNRLNFGSDLWYDSTHRLLYGLGDAGPAGDWAYQTRVQVFNLDINTTTGKINTFELAQTIGFKTADGSQSFLGGRPAFINGSPTVLGNSFDPEGFVLAPNGHMYVSDEWGPSIYEFEPVTVGGAIEARFVRSIDVPARWLPVDANGVVNYEAGADPSLPALVSGRQNGRGLESLTLSPDGTMLTVMMQAPLQDEGNRKVRNERLGTYDLVQEKWTGEYVYQVESLDDINARVAPDTFGATQQGRNITPNAMTDLGGGKYLVLERDNRGIGTANPIGADQVLSHVGTKRVYQIDVNSATDVSGVTLPTNGDLVGAGIVPISKLLYLDIDKTLQDAGLKSVEKFEGLALIQGDLPIMLTANDNDYSVLEVVAGGISTLYDVCTDGTQLPLNSDLGGRHLLPANLYSFAVPEPSTIGLLPAAVAGVLVLRRRRSRPIE